MITAAQAAYNLDVPSWLSYTGDHKILYHIPSGRGVYYLGQEVIFPVFRKSSGGLPTAHWATFSADVRVVEALVNSVNVLRILQNIHTSQEMIPQTESDVQYKFIQNV